MIDLRYLSVKKAFVKFSVLLKYYKKYKRYLNSTRISTLHLAIPLIAIESEDWFPIIEEERVFT